MLLVVKLGCFWHWYFWWNFFVMLTVLFYSSWGHWHKDNFEELGAQERNLWLQLHGPLWSISGKTWVPAAPTRIAMDRLVCSGLWCRWFRENMQKTLCPMHAASSPSSLISTGTFPSWLTCPLLAGAWKIGCYQRPSPSGQAAVKDLPAELWVCVRERSLSLLADFPAPCPGTEPASLHSPADSSMLSGAVLQD